MDSNNNNDNQQPQESTSTVSNLPVLFANGYPTSLDKMSEKQLEVFIPFMIKCSLNIRSGEELNYSPKWWPRLLEYNNPVVRPKNFNGNWHSKMKHLVELCYRHHNCYFLLKYSSDLSSQEPECLRFVNNNNSTTSLYNRLSKKLLLTFRNENMLYDKEAADEAIRSTLLPKHWNSAQADVDSTMFDIYLCDNCDAELYSEEAYVEHEKSCYIIISDDELDAEEEQPEEDFKKPLKDDFLLNFCLRNVTSTSTNTVSAHCSEGPFQSTSPEKHKRVPRRTRATITLSKCQGIPFSSPCGQFLMNKVKSTVTPEYQMERLDRLERFCQAPLCDKSARPKYLNATLRTPHTFRNHIIGDISSSNIINYQGNVICHRNRTERCRMYNWPRRTLYSRSRIENFRFLNQPLLSQLVNCSVSLGKQVQMDQLKELLLEAKKKKEFEELKEKELQASMIVEFIDLCSDGDANSVVGQEQDLKVDSAAKKRIDGSFLTIPLDPLTMDAGIGLPEPTSTKTHRQASFMLANQLRAYNSTSISTTYSSSEHIQEKNSQINNWLKNINNNGENNFNQPNSLTC